MVEAVLDPRIPLSYLPKYREFGFSVDDGPAIQLIAYCPWCGERLPDSLRGRFFDLLDEMKLEPDDAELPLDFRSDAWWRIRGIK